ncbi:hydrophobin-315 [Coprinopsis sp. MPI-PUGE-AT-0042]|nr:hydrophobin-315 [Coprinopsis sp. MPI-PUGE-AT-0042]
MFARLSVVALAFALVASVSAAPTPETEFEFETCNGGDVQCCNSVKEANALDHTTKGLLGLVGIDINTITAQVGLSCSSVNALALGGGSKCTQQKVCCSNNNFSGVVALGCTPINIGI